MPDESCRLFAAGKYWIKRARVALACLDRGDELAEEMTGEFPGRSTGVDGTLLVDLRVEDGRIRAVLPAGKAPCCCRALDLAGGRLTPLAEGQRLRVGGPADVRLDPAAAQPLVLKAGVPTTG